MDNVQIIQAMALKPYLPDEWESFRDLRAKLKANAEKSPGRDAFFMCATDRDEDVAITGTALLHVHDTRGPVLASWIADVMRLMSTDPMAAIELHADCPDESILPL